MFPRAYVSMKDVILKEYATKGVMKRRQLRSLIKIDAAKCNRIFDFFVEMGWLSNKP
jgi:transcriptional adapter 2-alpha